jgi:hypothetical protein
MIRLFLFNVVKAAERDGLLSLKRSTFPLWFS